MHRYVVPDSVKQRVVRRQGKLLSHDTIEAGRASVTVGDRSLERVSVDTTVMEKNIAHPTDARLYEKARRKLVALVGSRKALWIAAKTADTKKRYSLLKWRLQPKDA